MEKDNEIVLNYINAGFNRYKELLNHTGLPKKSLQTILDRLAKEEKIVYANDKYFPLKKATLIVKTAGYAFAKVEGEENDYFISEYDLGDAYNADTVLIYPYEEGPKLVNARVYKILERSHKYVVGVLKTKRRKDKIAYYIQSNMNDFPVMVRVMKENLLNANVGSIVVADVTYKNNAVYGAITQVLGYPDDPGIEISQIALEFGFKTPFPAEVQKELLGIKDEVLEEQKAGRRDFTQKTVITIDGDDSKDFDDAVYLEKLDNGNYQLEVYIADVAEYVKEGSPLDLEAFERGTSVYLADRVIPMIPRKLSNGICSLNEGVDRLVLSCLMQIDPKGNLVDYEICEGVIRSCHRMTYNKVNEILNGNKALCEEYSDIVDMLKDMQILSKVIRERRYKKGGIEFEVDEYKFTLNEDGSPKDIILRTRADAEKLIEDFMLMANETVAYHMNISNLPCVYRVHEKPDQEKLQDVFGLISNMGLSVKKTKNDIHPKQIQEALEQMSDSPFSPIINNLLLRSMMKAKYYEKCLGHYGLAMQYYCHFTSPIRRYPDLMTHRIIKRLLIHTNNFESDLQHFDIILPEVCLKNSSSERRAIECEREVDDMLYAWYMSRHVSEKFHGIITTLTQFGMFVTLDNGVEGLVAFRDMNGYFEYDAAQLLVQGGSRIYRIGQEVDIVVTSASKETRKIDFVLAEDYEEWHGR